MRRLFLVLLVPIFCACTKNSNWAFDQVHSEKEESRSTRLSYVSPDPIHGLDVEFMQTLEHLKVYLNVHSIPIPPSKTNPKTAFVTLEIDGKSTRYEAYRLDGGQRFLLSEEGIQKLIEALEKGQKVTASLAGYRCTLAAEDFAKNFDRLKHPFPIKNPFRLPF